MMELKRNQEFVRAIGCKDFESGLPSLPKISKLPDLLGIKKPYFVISPGASFYGRRWPTKYFAELIDKICAHTGWSAILCGSQAEYQLCADVATSASQHTLNLAGKVSLVELIEIIRAAKLLVGNETGAVHISSAVGTPSICILGGGHFGRFVPYKYKKEKSGMAPLCLFHMMHCYGCNWICTQPHEVGQAVPCIANIEVAQIFEQLKAHVGTTERIN
jgi:ADP-heptose:LPS heptosyltransferase